MKPQQGVITDSELLRRIDEYESGRTPTIPVTLEELDAIKAAEASEPIKRRSV